MGPLCHPVNGNLISLRQAHTRKQNGRAPNIVTFIIITIMMVMIKSEGERERENERKIRNRMGHPPAGHFDFRVERKSHLRSCVCNFCKIVILVRKANTKKTFDYIRFLNAPT